MKKVKIVVFAPLTHTDKIRQAIGEAGGGIIGNYDYCSFSSRGIGRFKPLKGAHPNIGEIGKYEEVEMERIEMVCPKENIKPIIAAIKRVHPYEEVGEEIYPLLDEEDL